MVLHSRGQIFEPLFEPNFDRRNVSGRSLYGALILRVSYQGAEANGEVLPEILRRPDNRAQHTVQHGCIKRAA